MFEYIIDKIEDMISDESEALAAGCASDYAAYCATVGKVSGFKMAILSIEGARKTLAEDENSEEEGMIDVETIHTK